MWNKILTYPHLPQPVMRTATEALYLFRFCTEGKVGDHLIEVWDLNDLKDDTLEMQEHVGEDIKENVEKHVRGFVAAAGKYT